MQVFLNEFEKFCEKPGVASNKARSYAKAIKYLCDYLNIFKMDSQAVAKIKSLEKDIRDKGSMFVKEFMSFLEERKQKSYLEGGFVQAALTPLFEYEQKFLRIKEKFRKWFAEQPQRNNPAVKYSSNTIDASIRLLESGMSKLGLDKYSNLNCFDIINYFKFKVVYDECYAFAEEFDKKQNHSDFRNGLDYYLLFLKELSTKMIVDKVKEIIQAYKGDFSTRDKEERYKWQAVRTYKKAWNINAENFLQMITAAFEDTGNLLRSGNYYPYKMLTLFAEKEPETVKSLFKILYDENLPFEERFLKFQEGFSKYYKPQNLRHYQDLHAVSVYLTCEYPEKYYIYKYTVVKEFIKQIQYECGNIDAMTDSEKMELTLSMYDIVLDIVAQDDELKEMSRARLDEGCYQDEALHMLAQDVIYFGSKYDEEANYWPSLDEYNPNLTKDDWKKYILEVEKPNHPRPMQMLKALMDLGGEATCKKLSEMYGGTVSGYVGCTFNLGRRAKKHFALQPCMDGEQERFFPIPFQGRCVLNDNSEENYSYRIRPELFEALEEIDLSDVSFYYDEKSDDMNNTNIDKNIILYGPPGTGKTYNTAIYAVAIIENKTLEEVASEDYAEVISRYNSYKTEGKIEFTTFHQSYGYEEFIEGIKPIVNEDAEVSYDIVPGTFKAFCDKIQLRRIANRVNDYAINENPNIWKVSLESTGDNLTRKECLENDHIRIGWDSYGKNITDETNFSQFGGKKPLNAFINRMRIGDIVLSCYSATTIDAIGVVTGEYEWHDEYPHYKRLRKVKWLVKDINENIMDITQGTTMTLSAVYRFSMIEANEILKLIDKHNKPKTDAAAQEDNYVFIIDEINRGNISKILGELITLIEPTKRLGQKEEMQAKLPYSQKEFGVPNNVYIIGTMNTADRSIAAIDTALRRRFSFKEMLPQADVLSGIEVEGISVSKMLEKMNRRIEVLYDREHTIGHAYFMPLVYDDSIETLAEIFRNKIIPLLQEYFYEDYDKIRLVLGDNQKTDEPEFIVKEQVNEIELFGEDTDIIEDAYKYSINDSAFTNIEAYKKMI